MWANHFPVIFLFAHALPNTFSDARKSCLDIPRTLRALFTQLYESFHNTALIVSSCAAANEFISWLVSNFMPSCVLSVSCRMLSEIRRLGGGHWLPFPPHYRVWNEQLFHNVFINLWHSTIDALQPIRRGSCSSGTQCCRSVSVSDLFAWMLVGVTTQRGGSLHLNFAHILTVINLKEW